MVFKVTILQELLHIVHAPEDVVRGDRDASQVRPLCKRRLVVRTATRVVLALPVVLQFVHAQIAWGELFYMCVQRYFTTTTNEFSISGVRRRGGG